MKDYITNTIILKNGDQVEIVEHILFATSSPLTITHEELIDEI